MIDDQADSPRIFFLLTSACAPSSEEWKRPVAPNVPLRGGMEFQVTIDYVILMSKQDVSITVRPGYWYGKAETISLFTKKLTGLGPDCVEAEFVARALDRREIARIPIRAVRTDKPPAPPEGGTPETPAAPKPPAPVPGAP